MKKITIAVDGYSSCGKSTMAKQLAERIGYLYIDSGAMYRAVTLMALRCGLFTDSGEIRTTELQKLLSRTHISFKQNPATKTPDTYLNGEDVEKEIRTMEVSSHVSAISALPEVRSALVAQQQLLGAGKGIIMDGRDIGTTVFPDAEMKVFVTASPEIRAQRRFDELQAKGQEVPYDDVLKNVKERDYIDSHREVSPLRQAADAVVLDNSTMTREEQSEWLLLLFKQRTAE